jgi:hypothetical protein
VYSPPVLLLNAPREEKPRKLQLRWEKGPKLFQRRRSTNVTRSWRLASSGM